MQRGRLFFIGLLSAIATIISLNIAFGNRWHGYDHYYRGYYHCNDRYDDHNSGKEGNQQGKQQTDSSTGNY